MQTSSVAWRYLYVMPRPNQYVHSTISSWQQGRRPAMIPNLSTTTGAAHTGLGTRSSQSQAPWCIASELPEYGHELSELQPTRVINSFGWEQYWYLIFLLGPWIEMRSSTQITSCLTLENFSYAYDMLYYWSSTAMLYFTILESNLRNWIFKLKN